MSPHDMTKVHDNEKSAAQNQCSPHTNVGLDNSCQHLIQAKNTFLFACSNMFKELAFPPKIGNDEVLQQCDTVTNKFQQCMVVRFLN